MARLRGRIGAVGILVLAAGCAGRPPVESPPSGSPPGEAGATNAALEASTSLISADEALSAIELLSRADDQLEREEFAAAARDYRKVVENAARKKERLRALIGWGTALDFDRRPREALQAYSRFVAEAPDGPQRESVRVRRVRLLVYLEKFSEAGRAASEVRLSDRLPLEQLALFAAAAHLALEEGRLSDAERSIARGRSVVDAHSLDRVTVPPLDVASLYFALGELHRRRAEEIKFDPIPSNFTQRLEERCQLILDAQGAFSEAMRSEDAHWSSMAGVKVGRLYQSLHSDLTGMPFPEAAVSQEKKQLFEGAIRLRYSILLTKSLAMMKATVALLDRTEEKSRWREKAREALREIQKAQKDEELAIDALPYSRAQLQQVLDEMAARAGGADSGS